MNKTKSQKNTALQIGATNVVVNNASNRNATNNSTTIAQQSGSSMSSLRQQSAHSLASTSGGGGSSFTNGMKDAGTISKQKQLSLQDMPLEILDKILSYVGYKHVSNMRLVSKA